MTSDASGRREGFRFRPQLKVRLKKAGQKEISAEWGDEAVAVFGRYRDLS
jgi:hypothetical protein